MHPLTPHSAFIPVSCPLGSFCVAMSIVPYCSSFFQLFLFFRHLGLESPVRNPAATVAIHSIWPVSPIACAEALTTDYEVAAWTYFGGVVYSAIRHVEALDYWFVDDAFQRLSHVYAQCGHDHRKTPMSYPSSCTERRYATSCYPMGER